TAIENILFSKYLMYKTVYWHKTVRIATAMIKKATALALWEGNLKPEQLYGLDDDEFYKTVHVGGCRPLELIDMVFNRNFYKSVYEADYRAEDHQTLYDLERRRTAEEDAARYLSRHTGIEWEPRDIVFDIPEPISFEVDLKVQTDNGYVLFRDTGSSFSPEIVAQFTQSLRKFRIFIPSEKVSYIQYDVLYTMLKEIVAS
ncbi:MAG: HD domain-containing protein, partial [Spirochaetales bacterium]|nr:HD domain-containing protein [Spirochaetales bacterium]